MGVLLSMFLSVFLPIGAFSADDCESYSKKLQVIHDQQKSETYESRDEALKILQLLKEFPGTTPKMHKTAREALKGVPGNESPKKFLDSLLKLSSKCRVLTAYLQLDRLIKNDAALGFNAVENTELVGATKRFIDHESSGPNSIMVVHMTISLLTQLSNSKLIDLKDAGAFQKLKDAAKSASAKIKDRLHAIPAKKKQRASAEVLVFELRESEKVRLQIVDFLKKEKL